MCSGYSECRACSQTGLVPILSLGETPLANALLTQPRLSEPEPRFPLHLVFCPSCSLVQIVESVPPEVLFSDYPYFSSFSETMLRSAQDIAQRIIRDRALSADSLIIEIASNDGYLLQYYKQSGLRVLGIEPAANIAAVAEAERGIPTLVEFFGVDLARRLGDEGMRADVIHANNVLAHVPDLNGVIEGFAQLLKPTGVAVIEVPYLREFIRNVEFDTIYHEHLCYFSLCSLSRLFSKNGLTIVDVEQIPIHGGSLRIFAAPSIGPNGEPAEPSGAVVELSREEAEWGVDAAVTYEGFADRVLELRAHLRSMLTEIKKQGMSIAAYGASAKGATLLNYCGIGAETLEFVADVSTVKQGLFTPGTHLEIVPPQRLLETMPDYVLLLSWNFADEIMRQQAEYIERGGRFIIPVPEPRVVPATAMGS